MGTTFSDNQQSNNAINIIPEVDHDTDWFNDIPETLQDSHQILQLSIMIIGDPNTGKTSIIQQYINNSFNTHYIPTTNIIPNTYWFKGNNIDLTFYDIPGSDLNDLKKLSTRIEWMCTHGINGLIAVYDVNNIQSYLNMQHILNKLLRIWYHKYSVKIPSLIMGNKMDCALYKQKNENSKIHINKWKVMKFCEYNKLNQRYDIDKKVLQGYKVLVDGYLRRYEQMLNMSREVLLSGEKKIIPFKVNTLCLLYVFKDMKCTMVAQQVSAKNHQQVVQCVDGFVRIVIDRYDDTIFDSS